MIFGLGDICSPPAAFSTIRESETVAAKAIADSSLFLRRKVKISFLMACCRLMSKSCLSFPGIVSNTEFLSAILSRNACLVICKLPRVFFITSNKLLFVLKISSSKLMITSSRLPDIFFLSDKVDSILYNSFNIALKRGSGMPKVDGNIF